MRSKNPVISKQMQSGFSNLTQSSSSKLTGVPLTYSGLSSQLWITALFLVAGVAVGWVFPVVGAVAGLIAFIFGLVVIIRGAFTGIIKAPAVLTYAVLEGAALGAVSVLTEAKYPGVALAATAATVVAFFAVLIAFTFGMRSNPKLTRIVFIGMIAYVAYLLLAGVIAAFTGFDITGTPFGMIIGLIAIAMGLYCLLSDFTDISRAIEQGVDDAYGWNLTFSLILSIVWVYIEFLRLFTNLAKNN